LDYLGFPWILSSESRLFNGLHDIFAGEIFPALLSVDESSRTGDAIFHAGELGFLIREV
jgi:hypothetical protein